MKIGYSTNSIGDIPPLAAVPILADLGYRSLGITLDHHVLDPFAPDLAGEIRSWRAALETAAMDCVIETGARHLLDRFQKHEPTLMSTEEAGRRRRIDLLGRAIDIAAELGAGCVSLWSGVARDAAAEESLWRRLTGALEPVLEHAAARGVALGFEPEPGMFIDTLARADTLRDRLGRPPALRLTIDVGHLECMGERPTTEVLARHVADAVNVHLEDMVACRHEHLPLGEGEIDFASVLPILSAGYSGGIHLELPRQAHRWQATAAESIAFLHRFPEARS
jgi:L-ribulose-5-phosphate 3-epimerase